MITIISAAIPALVSLVIAVWSLLVSRAASETAKRTEVLRVKALEAGDTIMDALTDCIVAIEQLLFEIEVAGGIGNNGESLNESLAKIASNITVLHRCVLANAIYLTPEIRFKVESLTADKHWQLDEESLMIRLQIVKDLHEVIATSFQKTYLLVPMPKQ